jgi:hypothetical protein
LAVWGTKNYIHPDEYWQATEMAYSTVYGGVIPTWEWTEYNRIRSYLYPLYLSIPLRILDFLRLDYYFTVRASYYIAQWVLVVIGDYYYYKIGVKIVGEKATRLSMYMYIINKFY